MRSVCADEGSWRRNWLNATISRSRTHVTYLFLLADYVIEQFGINLCVVAALLQGNSIYLFGFDFRWFIARIDLERNERQ